MPQMMPLSWLMLFIFFFTMFLLFNMMNYYSHLPYYSLNNKNIKLNSFNWTW